ncbi:hypothetical protein [Bacillus pinisoli]|uniref:hypothetical protein n=1 Tax=Bacillus pinisoli TaxID=2901866 RepID=UPI001FF677F6|nr:hypothetical protein [Bacillus pinisoli]
MVQQTKGFKEVEYSKSVTLLNMLSSQTNNINNMIEVIDELLKSYDVWEKESNYKENFLDILNLKEFCAAQLASQLVDKQLIIDLMSSIEDLLKELYDNVCKVDQYIEGLDLSIECKSKVQVELFQLKNIIKLIQA